jgi:hypothetical protein
VGAWTGLRAGLNYNQNKLTLTGLTLDPILDVRQLQIDLSGSEQGEYHLTLEAKALGSSLAANATYVQPARDGRVSAIQFRRRSCRRHRYRFDDVGVLCE